MTAMGFRTQVNKLKINTDAKWRMRYNYKIYIRIFKE